MVFGIVITIMIISIAIQLLSHRKDKYQRIVRSVFYRTQRPGAGAWGYGPWYYGSWDVGEKVNESIARGRAQYAHQQPHRQSHHRKGSHHQKHH